MATRPFDPSRRAFLRAARLAGLGVAGLGVGGSLGRALFAATAAAPADHEFFVFVHAAGGWDVTLWADPRNERRGLVEPGSTDNLDPGPVKLWVDQKLDEDTQTFAVVQPKGCNIPFGPGIGRLVERADRLSVVNGLAMNTVSHPDGTAYSVTGRHLVGGRVVASSVDTMLANELGREATFPTVSIAFPSSYVGDELDRRVVPLRISNVGAVTRTLTRSERWETSADRDAVTALLADEARELAKRAQYPGALQGLALQYDALRRMLKAGLADAFSVNALKAAQPSFDYKARFAGGAAVNAAFAVEAMKRNVVRCVSLAMGGFDTHTNNYRQQPLVQQELFGLLRDLLDVLDATPHPALPGKKLADHTHVLVVSDFCRTPQINVAQGRDHYPNNSALVISPRWRRNVVFGKTDPEQLLPVPTHTFSDGLRATTPADLLATFVAGFGVSPRKYLRDGEVVSAWLA